MKMSCAPFMVCCLAGVQEGGLLEYVDMLLIKLGIVPWVMFHVGTDYIGFEVLQNK